ncbi:MAG: hypothetical protein ACLFWL_05780 [Candidatus Brocadiia bacterium]
MHRLPLIGRILRSPPPSILIHDLYPLPSIRHGSSPAAGWQSFDQRALLLAREGDIICLGTHPDPHFLDYLKEFDFGPDNENILVLNKGTHQKTGKDLAAELLSNPGCLERLFRCLQGTTKAEICPYFPAESHFELAQLLRDTGGISASVQAARPEVARTAADKSVVRKAARDMQVPLAPGAIVRTSPEKIGPLNEAVHEMARQTGRVLLRGTIGAGGSTTFLLEENIPDLQKVISKAKQTPDAWLVDVHYKIRCSPNIEFFLNQKSGKATCVGVTDQRFDDKLNHLGNAWPSRAHTMPDMVKAGARMADWYLNMGGKGLVGMDFVEYENPKTGQIQFLLAELNPRINAATYPLAIVERLNHHRKNQGLHPIKTFFSGHIATGCKDFNDLRKRIETVLYRPNSQSGLFPYNTGALFDGHFGAVICATDRKEGEAILKETVQRAKPMSENQEL